MLKIGGLPWQTVLHVAVKAVEWRRFRVSIRCNNNVDYNIYCIT